MSQLNENEPEKSDESTLRALGHSPEQTKFIVARARLLLKEVPQLGRAEALQMAMEKRPLHSTITRARRIVRARRIAASAAILEAAYERACDDLEAVGASFELLVAWHNGERGAEVAA
jgi:predicted TIM-barrel fold metal-dependent hydrolase